MKIEEISLEILGLEKQLLQVVKHSGLLVKKSRESATTLFEFGQSLTWLGQSEGDAVGAALTQVKPIFFFFSNPCRTDILIVGIILCDVTGWRSSG